MDDWMDAWRRRRPYPVHKIPPEVVGRPSKINIRSQWSWMLIWARSGAPILSTKVPPKAVQRPSKFNLNLARLTPGQCASCPVQKAVRRPSKIQSTNSCTRTGRRRWPPPGGSSMESSQNASKNKVRKNMLFLSNSGSIFHRCSACQHRNSMRPRNVL